MMHPVWKEWLGDETRQPYFRELSAKLKAAWTNAEVIYPPRELIFRAFAEDPRKIRVVIIGQDPYANIGEAHGLCFSVKRLPLPASLRNIAQELVAEGFNPNAALAGDLSSWSSQGVFLLNRILTVPHKMMNGHKNWGWEKFTDKVVRVLQAHKEGVIFLLWGQIAQQTEPLIDQTKQIVLKTSHPSPLGVYRGFNGCNHFRQVNDMLVARHLAPIIW